MSIAIFGTYSYWNDGIGWKDFSERGDTQEVIENSAQRWFQYKEQMIIEDAIGADVSEIQSKIEERYNQLITDDKRRRRIEILKVSIRHAEQWLENRDLETERLTKQLVDAKAELEEIMK